MKRPSFQFYPADWQANSNLRRCTHEEKGIWLDIMCLLHDQEEYGMARWPLKELAQAVGAPIAKVKALVSKGILKGADAGVVCEAFIFTPTGSGRKKGDPVTLIAEQDGPLWYSSRMVVDEYKRVIRGEYGSTPKTAPDTAPKPPFGAAPKTAPDTAPSRARASSSSTSSVNPELTNSLSVSTVGTPAGAVCARLKSEVGMLDMNPQHPKLLALLDAGITDDELVAAGHEAKQRGKGFAYALATAEGRRRDAANVKPLPARAASGSLSQAGQRTAEAAARWLESQGVQP